MTVYSLRRYHWQTPAEIGAQGSDYCWLLHQADPTIEKLTYKDLSGHIDILVHMV